MLTDDKLASLSWEPRIMKHTGNYDDPWQRSRSVVGAKWGQKSIPVRVLNLETGAETFYDSISQCGKALNLEKDQARNAMVRGGVTMKKYRIYAVDTSLSV